MYVQQCLKGIGGITSADALMMLESTGILCTWWRNVHSIAPVDIQERLTPANLDLHVNAFNAPHPVYSRAVRDETPFISLTAGSVERDTLVRKNHVHPAYMIALEFAAMPRVRPLDCFVFVCWVIVGHQQAVEIPGVAEEVRELHVYRRYSAFQLEGEIAAKIHVPAVQIERVDHWRIDAAERFFFVREHHNPGFVAPTRILNYREAI